jgi:alpha-tubulin suppressor-like RCC1 family protein
MPVGSDSGWYAPTNPAALSTTPDFTTSTGGQTYTVAVQAKCVVGSYASPWSSTSGSASYTRPVVWTQIGGGWHNTCGLASNGKVYCWGRNQYGQLGNNNSAITQSLIPIAVDTSSASSLYGKTVKSIAVGSYHTCALATDNTINCWGYNTNGQLGNNDISITKVFTPVQVNTTSGISSLYGKTIASIVASDRSTCALATDNTIHCWGGNDDGNLGNNSVTLSIVPTQVNTASGVSSLYGKTIRSIAAAYYGACALATDNTVSCWGDNDYGEIGDNTYGTDRLVPTLVNTASGISSLYGKTVAAIAPASDHACALTSDGIVHCWGFNNATSWYRSLLGINTYSTSYYPAPVLVNTTIGVSSLYGKTVTAISAGFTSSCALASDNTLHCWGQNDLGQLGVNDTVDTYVVPKQVNVVSGVSSLYGKTIKAIVNGAYTNCALATDGTVHCWGRNYYGQAGVNSATASILVPTAVISPF